jgi:hypothetical protein
MKCGRIQWFAMFVCIHVHGCIMRNASMYGHQVSRPRTLIGYALVTLVVAALFAVFIGFKGDAALVGALSAAGTVAAAGFAALAAMGSMRAAADSSATAKRSREALARTMRPRIHPSVSRENGRMLGKVQCGEGRGAVDVTVAWRLTNSDTVTDRIARLEPRRPDLPPGSDVAFAVDLKIPETANVWKEISMVWIEYWDDSHVGHWQDTWRVDTEAHGQGMFLQLDSQLVD